MKGQIWVGTSGYVYNHWRGNLYPMDLTRQEWFHYYQQRFRTVEINNTFYQLPKEEAFENWEKVASKSFIYAVKVNRYLTHMKKLEGAERAWHNFWNRALLLKAHLGPILFQLPPRWKVNRQRLERLAEFLPQNQRFVFEFRDRSWWCDEVFEVLRKNSWVLVVVSHPTLPTVEEITGDFVYVRMHGENGLCTASYSEEELQSWADKIRRWSERGLDVYVYFNNDAHGFAPKNALSLARIIG